MQVHGPFNPAFLIGPALVMLVWVGLAIYCINDLYRPDRRVLGFTKNVWALVIVFIGILGAVFYLLYGRDTSSR
jgi:phospholipase D-like protein